ncbi:MAG: hypothetical protein HXX81_00740 [Campylobacterales bacterium]|nr:hypothetical protein [Campylobacterales bacterium]
MKFVRNYFHEAEKKDQTGSMFGMMVKSVNVKISAFYSLIFNLLMQIRPNHAKIELFQLTQIKHNQINR